MTELVCPIKSLENLLLVTDGSEFSEGAEREGVKLAKICRAKIMALTVIEFNPEFEAMAPNLVEKMESEASAHLKSVKERAGKEGVTCETMIRRSENPYGQIVREVEKLNADMVVMGRHGRTGLKRILMGSVTARVIGHSTSNVLVVPESAKLKFQNILVATDGSTYGDAAAIEAINIAKVSGGSLIVLSVADTDEKEAMTNANRVEKAAAREGIKAEAIVEKGKVSEVIVDVAQSKNADFIVMGTYGKTGLQKLLMGSVTEKVVGFAESAVLVVKAEK